MPDLDFDMPQNQSSSIKVIGVGGGGSNAVNYMYDKGIRGVDFVVCNTDQQALDDSPVPNKIQLGVAVTEGLGAGAWPLKGRMAAEENIQDVIDVLEHNTKMVFINAGMGGGTGTGAAPIIAKAAKDMDILTVAIVTIPFYFEGDQRMIQAKEGIEELKKHVDSLIVINNNKLREIYGNLGFRSGFAKADEILATASKGIAEVITQKGHLNIDLNDAKTVLSNSGTAIMGSGTALGDGRAIKAVKAAIESPLLDNNHIRGAKKVLLLIVSGTEEVTFEEMGEISDFIQNQVTLEGGTPADIIMGVAEDEELDSAVNVTVVATGFHEGKSVNLLTGIPEKVVYPLGENSDDKKLNRITSSPINVGIDKQVNNNLDPSEAIVESFNESFLLKESQVEDCQDHNINVKAKSHVDSLNLTDIEIVSDRKSEINPTKIFESTHEAENIIEEGEELVQKQVSMTFDLDPSLSIEDTSPKRDEPKIVFNLIEEIENESTENNDIHSSESKLLDSNQEAINNEESVEDKIYYSLDDDEKETVVTTFSSDSAKLENDIYSDDSLADGNNKTKEHDSLLVTKPNDLNITEEEKSALKFGDSHFEESSKVIGEKENHIESSSTETLTSESPVLKEQIDRAQKRKERLQKFNYRFRNSSIIQNAELEPAYKRQGVKLNSDTHSSEAPFSKSTLEIDDDGEMMMKDKNSFLHDSVD
jgi:cell division protein FtsZ